MGYDHIESHSISQRHLANVKSASLFDSYIKEKYFVVEASKSAAEPEKTIHKANKDLSNSNYSDQEESEHHYRLLVAKFTIQHDLPFTFADQFGDLLDELLSKFSPKNLFHLE